MCWRTNFYFLVPNDTGLSRGETLTARICEVYPSVRYLVNILIIGCLELTCRIDTVTAELKLKF